MLAHTQAQGREACPAEVDPRDQAGLVRVESAEHCPRIDPSHGGRGQLWAECVRERNVRGHQGFELAVVH